MDPRTFAKVAESLRQYRRADLGDFADDLGGKPVDALYIDPLPSNGVLDIVLSSNTTFLLGRKGTGKSTIFARAQSEIRERGQNISIYVDVKALYELLREAEAPLSTLEDGQISEEVLRQHLIRKSFLSSVLSDLIQELYISCEKLPFWSKILGNKKLEIEQVRDRLARFQIQVKQGKLTDAELPILRAITKKTGERITEKERIQGKAQTSMAISPKSISGQARAEISALDEALSDTQFYQNYSDVVLRSFPFSEILTEVKNLLQGLGLKRLIIFFDDFSEITWVDQRLFVDVVLAPLNNSSDERVKLKIAGYPGRVYYGKIDPGKIDTLCLDFYEIYKSHDIQSVEAAAIDYTTRLLTHRFKAFGMDIADYFATRHASFDDLMRILFEVSFNVPRLLGYILK